jgi:hypothetical protein
LITTAAANGTTVRDGKESVLNVEPTQIGGMPA